ncbi:hypothetical protein V1514DRAFT_323028 [Lipomyces japonicus]|uniref:uncharacterized protein n=1 Tax=Lipomyces japonicus TaxID=56871 RepID=UPI0034CF9589
MEMENVLKALHQQLLVEFQAFQHEFLAGVENSRQEIMDQLERVRREQEAQHEMINGVAATREELAGLREEVVGLQTHVNAELAAVRVGFQEFRDRLEEKTVEMEETVADLRAHVNEDTGAVDDAVNDLRARINVPPSQDQGAGGRSSLPKIKLPDAFVGDGSDLVDVTTFIHPRLPGLPWLS